MQKPLQQKTPYPTYGMEEWLEMLSEWKNLYINFSDKFQLPQWPLVVILELMGNGFLMTLMIYGVKLSASYFWGLWHNCLRHLSCMLFVSQLQSMSFESNVYRLQLNISSCMSMVQIDWQSGFFGGTYLSCTPKLVMKMIWPKMPIFCNPENDHLLLYHSHF